MTHSSESDSVSFKGTIPVLPIRDIVVYPFMILPLFVGRETSILAVEEALISPERHILLVTQKDVSAEIPEPCEIYSVGTVAMIMRMRKLPDGRIKILVQGLAKAHIQEFIHVKPFYKAKVEKFVSIPVPTEMASLEALMRNVRENLEKIISVGNKGLSPDILMILEDIHDAGRLADLVASNLNLKVAEAQMILETADPIRRLESINSLILRELEILNLQAKIRSHNHNDEMSKSGRDQFLRDQMKAIKNELGDEEEEVNEFDDIRRKILRCKVPMDVERESLKQLSRLEKMHPDSSEASILRTYLEWVYELPWSVSSEESLDLGYSKQVLDEDHFDLEKVKDRILEYLAVKTLKGKKMKGPILCFSGPPGVGKTSLGKSIAKATGREFVRISLGGVKDEAEIRGHRRTYVGAMPGRFIQAMKQAGTNNPIIMLDEIDKLASDFRGDPAAALLEVLDPEQNNTFRDHYLNIPFDLSNVMFIATANNIENIPPALLDRMEILRLTGYSQEEKAAITKKYLINRQMEENGISSENIDFTEEGIASVITHYTKESGLRNLERQIGTLCRKVAKQVAIGLKNQISINAQKVEEFLGPAIYMTEDVREHDEVGVATGLAWTSAGGEVLSIEVTKMKGRGLTLTGQLGDVMKESAQTAIGFIRSHAEELGIDPAFFENNEIHIHLPAGAVPKDGPSAGVTLATAIVSLITGNPVAKDVAMTGEMTLTGKVLPVGGVKEKVLAAMRMGITTVIIPWKNKNDLIDIPENFRKKIAFIPVKGIEEVLQIALVGWENGKPFKQEESEKQGKKKNKSHPLAA
ncbi:MAG: endopeptidase La [Bacteriovoracaceae bacterium]|nr:endopeptidase La [Bacteriovoracaceae bacterium]